MRIRRPAPSDGASHFSQTILRESDAPQPWLLVENLDGGRLLFTRDFATQAQALAAAAEINEIWNAHGRHFQALADSPELPVRVDALDMTLAHRVAMRRNWLERCRCWLQPAFRTERPADVFTWKEAAPSDLYQTRLGGQAVVPAGAKRPICGSCGKPPSFVALVNFAGCAATEVLPGDVVAIFLCYECPESKPLCFWTKGATPLDQIPSVGRRLSCGVLSGERWRIRDYDWTLAQEFLVEGSYDESLVGHCPYGIVTAMGTKIGGYPSWIQGEAVRKCRCGERMRFVAQVRPQKELMFGDAGLFYILVCPKGTCATSEAVAQSF